MHKIVVTDYTFPNLKIEQQVLEPARCELAGHQCRTPEALIEVVRDADYVLTQFAPMNADVVGVMERAKVIVRYGIGYDNVDLEAARARGIPVCNVPEFCTDEVADHTLGLMLAATRCLLQNHRATSTGNWGLAVPLGQMRAISRLTVGIVGLGRIGRAVAKRLAGFGCRIMVCDPAIGSREIEQTGGEAASLDDLLGNCDLITLHCPSSEATRWIINESSIAKMKPGVILINVGRGDLVNPDALMTALNQERISAVGLDVFSPEPIPADHPILRMENVIVGSHIASASEQAAVTLRESAAKTILNAIKGEPLPNIVNGVSN
ncbi:MAG: C-terminal binding protein [Verrucomicrobiota bacterium]|jgi:D-3-phosphoglycerate dehydrogenase|nr:C-terminal binding protein [Verrucomicrobiota bacterium]MDP7048600.1 C-terminal binding protein [Verrucomicrobiota bacterium]